MTTKKVEENIRRMLDIQSYNKNRMKMLKNIEQCIQILVEIKNMSLTHISQIQVTVHKLKQYPNVFTDEEKSKMESIIESLISDSITENERKILLDSLNNLKAKVEKGDAILDEKKRKSTRSNK